ncbi:MAG: DNA-directed DNA polymerase [Candidatus Woesearchaeota archaeon]
MIIEFFPMDITAKSSETSTEILIFGRTNSNEKICVVDKDYMPDFFVVPRKARASLQTKLTIEGMKGAKKVEAVKRKINGIEFDAFRIFSASQKAAVELAQSLSQDEYYVFEHDIDIVEKYCRERGITPFTCYEADVSHADTKLSPTDTRQNIETYILDSIRQVSTEASKFMRVLAIDVVSTFDSRGNEKSYETNPVMLVSLKGGGYAKSITWKHLKAKDQEKREVEYVGSELGLLEALEKSINEYAPDIIVGFNSDEDLKLLHARAQKYNIKLRVGLDGSGIRVSKGRYQANIVGVVHADLLRYATMVAAEDEAGDFISTAKSILNTTAPLIESVRDKEDIDSYIKYSSQNAQLKLSIFENLFPELIELAKITGSNIDSVCRSNMSQIVEAYLINQSALFGELVPNKPTNEQFASRKERRKRRTEIENTSGFSEDIVVISLKNIYPYTVVENNISPSSIKCACCAGIAEKIHIERNDIRSDIGKDANDEIWFCTVKKGFIVESLQGILERTARIKEILKKSREDILVKRMNLLSKIAFSFYNYFTYPAARWYSRECFLATSVLGQGYISQTIKSLNKERILFNHNNELVFLQATQGKSLSNIRPPEVQQHEELLLERYIDFSVLRNLKIALSGWEPEIVGYYERGIFIAGKDKEVSRPAYALLQNNRIILRGFSFQKKIGPRLLGNLIRALILQILKEKSPDTALSVVKEAIYKIRNHLIEPDELIIKFRLQKGLNEYDSLSPAICAAQRMKSRGLEVGLGDSIEYIIVRGDAPLNERARTIDEIKKDEYDAEYYINSIVLPAIEPIMAVFGFKKENILQSKEQSRLQDWI